MRISIRHVIVQEFAPPARALIQKLRLRPRVSENQHVMSWSISFDVDCQLRERHDTFGNCVQTLDAEGPLQKLTMTARGEIDTFDTAGVLRGEVERFSPEVFLRDTDLTQCDPALRKFAREAIKGHKTELDKPHFLMRAISEAKEGRYLAERRWLLTDVTETRFSEAGTKVVKLADKEWDSVLTPEVLAVLMVDPQKMSAWNLFQYTRHLAENKQRTSRYEIALWKKVVYPLAVVVMMALALPFAYLQVRAGGIGYKVFAGIMLGIVCVVGIALTAVFVANHRAIFPAAALVAWSVLAYLCVEFGFWIR